MKNIFKLTMNITLLVILLGIVALPTGFMGIMSYEDTPVVLSSQDSRDQNIREEPATIRTIDDPESNVPEYVKEVILRMEREYYEKNNPEFVVDIEREENQETPVISVEEPTSIN